MDKRFVSVVGAGKVGSALSKRLFDNGYRFSSVISKTKSSAKALASLVKCNSYSDNIKDISRETTLIILSAPDTELRKIADEIALIDLNYKLLNLFHVSGSMTADVLRPLSVKGASVFSIHPFQTFASKTFDSEILDSVTFGIEGDEKGVRIAKALVKSIKGKYIVIPGNKKKLYHICGVFASNYMITLLSVAEDILSDLDVDSQEAKRILSPIINKSIENYYIGDFKNVITGPAARGDYEAIYNHIESLKKYDKDVMKLYKAFGMMIQKKLPEGKNKKKIQKLLI